MLLIPHLCHILGKIMLLESVLKTIREDNLLEETRKAGDVLLKGLKDAQIKFPGLVHSARGIGTYCAINADTSARYVQCVSSPFVMFCDWPLPLG